MHGFDVLNKHSKSENASQYMNIDQTPSKVTLSDESFKVYGINQTNKKRNFFASSPVRPPHKDNQRQPQKAQFKDQKSDKRIETVGFDNLVISEHEQTLAFNSSELSPKNLGESKSPQNIKLICRTYHGKHDKINHPKISRQMLSKSLIQD